MLRCLPVMLLAGCATITPASPREGPVPIGATANVGGPRVQPLALVEDSRCPMNARCVWAGRVVIDAAVTTGRGTRRIRLILGEPQRVADGTLALVAVTPDRVAGKQVGQSDYRFAFDFQGGL